MSPWVQSLVLQRKQYKINTERYTLIKPLPTTIFINVVDLLSFLPMCPTSVNVPILYLILSPSNSRNLFYSSLCYNPHQPVNCKFLKIMFPVSQVHLPLPTVLPPTYFMSYHQECSCRLHPPVSIQAHAFMSSPSSCNRLKRCYEEVLAED